MFDQLSDRIATAVATGLDIAVEFATLGEYRLAGVPAPGAPAPAAPRPRGQVFDGSRFLASAPAAVLPKPSTAAIRPKAAPAPDVLGVCCEGRSRAKAAKARGAKPVTASQPRPRARLGAVTPAEQLCLWP